MLCKPIAVTALGDRQELVAISWRRKTEAQRGSGTDRGSHGKCPLGRNPVPGLRRTIRKRRLSFRVPFLCHLDSSLNIQDKSEAWPHSDQNKNCSCLLKVLSATLKNHPSAQTLSAAPPPDAGTGPASPGAVRPTVPTKEPAHRFGPKSRVGPRVPLWEESDKCRVACPEALPGHRGQPWASEAAPPAGPTRGFPPEPPALPSGSWTRHVDRLSNLTQNFPSPRPARTSLSQGDPRTQRAPRGPREPARGLRGDAPPCTSPHGRGGRHPRQNSTPEPGDRGWGGKMGKTRTWRPYMQASRCAAAAVAAAKRFQILAGRQRLRRPAGRGRGFPRSHSPPPFPPLRRRPAARRCHGDPGTYDSHRPAVRRQRLPALAFLGPSVAKGHSAVAMATVGSPARRFQFVFLPGGGF